MNANRNPTENIVALKYLYPRKQFKKPIAISKGMKTYLYLIKKFQISDKETIGHPDFETIVKEY